MQEIKCGNIFGKIFSVPKYYCASGNFRNITDAPDALCAAKKTLTKIMKNENDLGLLMVLNEKGFDCKTENLITPTIPILKLMDIHLGDDETLEKLICASLKIKREDISDKEMHWLISGVLEEEKE